ncbi:MAG: HPr kinase/phosphatase C-terminal domain-containing protein [Pseudomonadota bacterium]
MTENVHACAIVLCERGLLIRGASGSGKSSLAAAMVEAYTARGRFARLVSDDRTNVRAVNGRLVASVPEALQGLLELRGVGIIGCRTAREAVVSLVVDLLDPSSVSRAPRPEETVTEIAGIGVERVGLSERATPINVLLLSALVDGAGLTAHDTPAQRRDP